MKLLLATTLIALIGASLADYAQPPKPGCGGAVAPAYPTLTAPPAPAPSYSVGVQEVSSQSGGYESFRRFRKLRKFHRKLRRLH